MQKHIIFIASIAFAVMRSYALANDGYPPLHAGDLVFQTSKSSQSSAIFVATSDSFTHMGIIKKDGDNIVVIEAGPKVRELPLRKWVNRGILKRVAIYRDPELTEKQAKKIISSAKTYYGKTYDIFFSFNNYAIYCSELPYLTYKNAGISIGNIQKISELNFNNDLVKNLIEKRWQHHAECKQRQYDFKQCYHHILDQELITPASIAKDPKFVRIYSDYPF